MQLGEKKETKYYPKRVKRSTAIPAPDIFTPKTVPAEQPVEAPIPMEMPSVPTVQP